MDRVISYKKQIFGAVVFTLLLVAIPATMYLVRQQQILRSRAAEEDLNLTLLDQSGQQLTLSSGNLITSDRNIKVQVVYNPSTPALTLGAPTLLDIRTTDLICYYDDQVGLVYLRWDKVPSPAPSRFILNRDGVSVASNIGSGERRYGDFNVPNRADPYLYTIQGVWPTGTGPVSNSVSVTVDCT